MSQWEPAKDAFHAAVLVAPQFLGARISLSHALRKMGDLQGAEQQARIALTQSPGDAEALFALGRAQAKRGSRKQAKQSLEAFVASGPEVEARHEVEAILGMLGLGEEGEPLDLEDD
jgi:uncharacterized protein HemY